VSIFFVPYSNDTPNPLVKRFSGWGFSSV